MGGNVQEPILDRILKDKKREVSLLQQVAQVKEGGTLTKREQPVLDFLSDWRGKRGKGIRVIAESKAKSPSRGIIREPYDPVSIAREYALAGASAISVLTDATFFGGDISDISHVKKAFLEDLVHLPVLRKDFLIDPLQIHEAYLAGADIVLLIVRILEGDLLVKMIDASRELGMEPLVEVHSEVELERALDAGAMLLGVNHRDLDTLQMDLSLSARLSGKIPDDVLRIAESGLKTNRDCRRMIDLGYDAVLVGESFLTASHPGHALKDFLTNVG